jgi:hypothetical protein
MARPKKIVTPKSDAPYSVSVFTAGKAFHGNGATIHDALEKIKIDTFKAKAILQVECKGIKKEIVVQPLQLRRLVLPRNRMFFEKRLLLLLS